MLSTMLGHDFGDQIGRYAAMLVNPNYNELEVLVQRNNGGIFLTKGWRALRDFYNVSLGAWVTVVLVGNGKFKIRIKDRFGKSIRYPTFIPTMKFVVNRIDEDANLSPMFPFKLLWDDVYVIHLMLIVVSHHQNAVLCARWMFSTFIVNKVIVTTWPRNKIWFC